MNNKLIDVTTPIMMAADDDESVECISFLVKYTKMEPDIIIRDVGAF